MSKILKNRSNDIASLLKNFSQAEKSLETSLNSAGSAAKENAAYIDSIQGRINQLKATFEDLSSDLIDSQLVKTIVNGGTGILSLLDKSIEKLGTLGTLFTTITTGMMLSKKYNDLSIIPINALELGINKLKTAKAELLQIQQLRKDDYSNSILSFNEGKSLFNTQKIFSLSELDTDELKPIINDVSKLSDYMKIMKSSNVSDFDLDDFFKDTSDNCKEFIKTTEISTTSINEFAQSEVNAARQSKGLEVQTQATSKAMTLLKGAASLALSVVTSILISEGIKLFQKWINKIEDAKTAIEELAKSYKDTISELENINSKLEDNKKLIDEMNKNPLDNIEKENLKTLQEENSELAIQKEILESIANLQKQNLQNQTKDLLHSNSFGINQQTGEITSDFWSKVTSKTLEMDELISDNGKYITSNNDIIGSIISAVSGGDDLVALIQTLFNVGFEDYFTQYDKSLDNAEKLISDIKDLDVTNGNDASTYLKYTEDLNKMNESLQSNAEYLITQKENLSETSKEYKEIISLLERFKNITDEINNSNKSFSEQLLDSYTQNYDNFAENYDKVHKKINERKSSYLSEIKSKGNISSIFENEDDVLDISNNLNNILSKNSITIDEEYGTVNTKSYSSIITSIKEINTLKEKGLWIDKADNNAIYNTLLSLADLTEEDIPFINFDETIAAYDFLQKYLNDNEIDTSDIAATTYKSFISDMKSEAEKNGINTSYFEEILLSLFPSYQNNKDLFNSYINQVPKSMSDELFDKALKGVLSAEEIQGNEKLINDLDDMGIKANEAAVYLYELQKAILSEQTAANKTSSESLASSFINNKSDLDENKKDNIDKFSTAIVNIESGSAISSDEMWELINIDATLSEKFKKTAVGYTIASKDLIEARDKYNQKAIQDFKIDITKTKEAIDKSKKLINDLTTKRDSIKPTDTSSGREWAYWNNQIRLEEENLSSLNITLDENQKMYDELINPIVNYGETIESVSSKISDAISLHEQMRNEMNKTGSLSGDTLAYLIENVPNWEDIVTVDETGTNIIYDEEAFKESIKSSTGYTDKINEAKKLISAYEQGLRNLANKYGIAYDGGKTFEENLANIREQLKTSPNFTSEAAEEFTMLSDNMYDAQNAIAVLTVAFENFFKSFEENEYLTKFNEELDDLNHKKAMGQLSEADYNAGYSKIYNDFKTNAGDSKDVDVIDALNEAEETNYSNYQSQFQNEYEKEKRNIENSYNDKLISAEDYYNKLTKLNEEYYGKNGKINDIDGTEYDDRLRELVEVRQSIYSNISEELKKNFSKGNITFDELTNGLEKAMSEWLASCPQLIDEFRDTFHDEMIYLYEQESSELDKRLEQNLFTSSDYALAMGKLWEKYYKNKAEFAQEDYEAEQKYLSAIKDSVQEQIDGVQSIIDKNEELVSNQIDELEAQNDEIEKAYDTEIDKIQEQIDLLEDKNEKEERLLKIKEAEDDLEKAKKHGTKLIYTENGNQQYKNDDDTIAEKTKALEDARKEEEIAVLNDEKERLEKEKDEKLKINNDKIEVLNNNLKNLNKPLEQLVAVLASNLATTYGIDPTVIASILQTSSSKNEMKNQDTDAVDMNNTAEAAYGYSNKNNIPQKKRNDELKEKYTILNDTFDDDNVTESDSKVTEMINSLMSLMKTSTNTTTLDTMKTNIEPTKIPTIVNTNSVSLNIGDIVINNPVGDTDAFAKELFVKLPSAVEKRLYSNN